MGDPMKILAMATSYNRKSKTLRALRALHNQSGLDHVQLDVVLLNDGSTDGTAEAVKEAFPKVHIVHGDGKLYWAGGMRAVWSYVKREKVPFDHILVFNDDIELYKSALATLLKDHEHLLRNGYKEIVVTGNFLNKTMKIITYGGWIRSSKWHPLRMALVSPNFKLEEPTVVDTLNMNFTLISRSALERNGFLEDYFIHRAADFEFGLRVTKSGGVVASSSKVVGICDRNSPIGTSLEPGIKRAERLRRLFSAKEEPLKQRFRFYRKWGGLLGPILFVVPYVKALIERPSRRQ